MAREYNSFKAGLFIVISTVLAVVIFFLITGMSLAGGATADYTAEFKLTDDVAGLAPGADVRVGGVKVGAVRSVDIVNVDSDPRIRVGFRVPQAFALKQNARVDIQTGLTGLVNLNVTDLGKGAALSKTDVVPGIGSPLNRAISSLGDAAPEAQLALKEFRTVTLPQLNARLESLGTAIEDSRATLASIKGTSDNATELVKQVQAKVDPIVEKYNALTESITKAGTELGSLVGDGKPDLRATFANVKDITESTKTKLPEFLDKAIATFDSAKAGIDKTVTMLDDIRETVDNTKTATASVRSILTTNRSRIDEIVKNLSNTSSNFSAASGEIRRSPWRLLYTPSTDEVANQNLYDASRQFAEGARKLQDTSTALRDLLADPSADPERVKMLVKELDESFTQFQAVEKKVFDGVK
jgi:phospholipid/cholesterol/gamma-HCH transport system substrate-binding protein